MRLVIVGPGRAGGALAIAAAEAGHSIVGVASRDGTVDRFGPALPLGSPIPPCDVLLIAVRDDSIGEIASLLAPELAQVGVCAHLSGFTPVSALAPVSARGVPVGGFHPLQTLPDPESGAGALAGSYVGLGGEDEAMALLEPLAQSLGLRPFRLDDGARPAYHAAAAAAANFVITSLAVSADLFASAGIDPGVSRPLVDRVVANAFAIGPDAALTGPIARGDSGTVSGHLAAATDVSESLGDQFRALVEATALRVGWEGPAG